MTVVRARPGLLLVPLLAVSLTGVRPSHAYVRSVTSLGAPVWWRSPSVTMNIYLGAPPPAMTPEGFGNASVRAAAAWSQSDLACTAMSLAVVQNPGVPLQAGLDRKNVVAIRTDGWCRQQSMPDDPDRPCYPDNAMAVTTLFKNANTGELIDADVEINAAHFAWADLVAEPGAADGRIADYQNTLTHELGHVLGLAHNCYDSGDGPALLLDNTGAPEIDCDVGSAPAGVSDSTMYPVVAVDDTERRTLAPDDQQAVCDIYPAKPATWVRDAGCSVGGATSERLPRSPGNALVVLTGLALAVIACRRGRRASSS